MADGENLQQQTRCISVDFAKKQGRFRPYNSVNLVPMQYNMEIIPAFKELRPPYVRLHDCPFKMHGVVDVNYLFPLFDKNPDDPANYTFAKTDDYIEAIIDAGSEPYFRLGYTIEHTPRKYHVNPPPDFEKWAHICSRIVAHYTKGWACGFHHKIRYWEIWNEPDHPCCWTGTVDEFRQLYVTTAKRIKQDHPEVKVGGPGVVTPKKDWFLRPFFQYCQDQHAPLDFFSWHRYGDSPMELVESAEAAVRWLKSYGYESSESHCNEWNYFPAPKYWQKVFNPQTPEEARWAFGQITGPMGAAYTASSIILAQDAPIDLAFYLSGDASLFGLFDTYNLPAKPYYVFRAINEIARTPQRVATQGNVVEEGFAACACMHESGSEAAILVSSMQSVATELRIDLQNIPFPSRYSSETFLLDQNHALRCVARQDHRHEEQEIAATISSPCVVLIKLRKA